MSFLNPISLPVKRYSSSDEGAPQLAFYQASTFKNVLKACLVTGFGSKEGAGWTMGADSENETTLDLRSPHVSMAQDNLRLSAGGYNRILLRWTHKTGVSRSQEMYIGRNYSNEISYGWEMLVTDLGFFFIWDVSQYRQRTTVIFYYGQGKHALPENPNKNILLWHIGFTNSGFTNNYSNYIGLFADYDLSRQNAVGESLFAYKTATLLQIYDRVYLANGYLVLGVHPGLYQRGISDPTTYVAPVVEDWAGQSVLSLYCGNDKAGTALGIATDFWEF